MTTISRAKCDPATGADPDDWFAEPQSPRYQRAMAACMDCPLYHGCAEYALTEGIPDGIFGGMDGRERRKVWKGRADKPKDHMAEYDKAVRRLQWERAETEITLGLREPRGGGRKGKVA